ncbi:MAG TPA: glycoside hydrolase family 3 C-terminal domain-containing protein [Chitinivibrionales bacterium]|nr:glycoside hydrolase family 3 C-terminal domain-containing protein [Chitinivibrionales bacterium]
MLKKISALLIIFSASIFALPSYPTYLDSVVVPVKVISGSGTTWSGKVNYWLRVGDNDSLSISLQINPVGGAPACNISNTSGDVGTIQWANGINGKREIFFDCTFPTAPMATDKYTATVTILADQSNLEKTARNVLAGIPNSQKCGMLAGTGCFCTFDVTGVTAPSPFTTVVGFHMCDGPLGINMRDPNHVKCATLYPAPSARANAFDTSLSYHIGLAIGSEAKTANPPCGQNTIQNQNVNLAPMLNMVRDPRGGRDFETYGEDPFLTAWLATVDTRGRQANGIIAVPKHFVCNDQELNRETSSSNVDDTTLHQSYAYPFEMVVREAKPWGLMAAYNKLNGTLCTEDTSLLAGIAKREWGFRGFIVSDWYTWMGPAAIGSGLDIEMDWVNIFGKMCDGTVPQDTIDQKVLDQLRGKIWTGCVADFSALNGTSTINSPDHDTLAVKGAHESLVLVKNDSILVGGVKQAPLLPLNKTALNSVAVVGPYANLMRIGAECEGTSARVDPCQNVIVTPLTAIQNKIGAAKVTTTWANADVVIVFVGIPSTQDNAACEGHDRPDVVLPVSEDGTDQNALVQSILAAGKKTIVVLTGGAAVSQGAWSNASSILVAFFPGQGQGDAIADVLFGDYNPSGKLSVSFPKTAADLPPFTAEGAASKQYQYEGPSDGKGYSYYLKTGKIPLFWFGWGLHYCTYTYSNMVCPRCAAIGSKVSVSVDVTNNGPIAGDEIVQLYLSQKTPIAARPIKQLRGFARVSVTPGHTQTVNFNLREWDFAHWVHGSGWTVDPNSTYNISIEKYANDPNALVSSITLDPAAGGCQ